MTFLKITMILVTTESGFSDILNNSSSCSKSGTTPHERLSKTKFEIISISFSLSSLRPPHYSTTSYSMY